MKKKQLTQPLVKPCSAGYVAEHIESYDSRGYDFVGLAVDTPTQMLLVFRLRETRDYAKLVRVALDAATACRIIESCVNSDYDSEHSLDAIANDLEAAARAATE